MDFIETIFYTAQGADYLSSNKMNTLENSLISLKSNNQIVSASLLPEVSEKYQNDLLMENLSENNLFTGEMKELVFAIANQCPIAGGDAVYQARSLYELLEPGMIYNDDQLCQTGVDPIQIPTSNIINGNNIKLFPNPATEEINIELYLPDLGLVDISIIDSYGRVVKQTSLSNTNRTTISTTELAQGVYYCQIKKGQNIIDSKRFVIIR